MPPSLPWLAQAHVGTKAWPVILAVRGPGFGAESEPTPAADAAAWSLVALLLFCLMGFAFGLWTAKKHHRKAPLNDEFQDKPEAVPRKEKREPWQKPEDWWKGNKME